MKKTYKEIEDTCFCANSFMLGRETAPTLKRKRGRPKKHHDDIDVDKAIQDHMEHGNE